MTTLTAQLRMACLGTALCLLAGTSAMAAGRAAAPNEVDLQLVVTVDVSRPMDRDEQVVARDGYVQAFQNQEVIDAITQGGIGRIAVTYVEFADPDFQTVVIPWTVIDSREKALAFSDQLRRAPLQWEGGTSLSADLLFSAKLLETSGFTSPKMTIDVSGNGPNNAGTPVTAARDQVVAKGITINGLPIDLGPREAVINNLADYYDKCVIGGPTAFSYPVNQISQLPMMIRRKLVQEIAQATEPPTHSRDLVIRTQAQAPAVDCMVGENFFRFRFR